MIIANKLREKNRAEYVLYMWQIEDLLRAYHCDMEHIRHDYLKRFNVPNDVRAEMEEWYENLCNMMTSEGVTESGHLQINKNAVDSLQELHDRLINSQKYPFYHQLYYKILPYIVEVRAKGSDTDATEIETALQVLYGLMMLRLQAKEVSSETLAASKDIATLLGQLSDYYFKDKETPLEF